MAILTKQNLAESIPSAVWLSLILLALNIVPQIIPMYVTDAGLQLGADLIVYGVMILGGYMVLNSTDFAALLEKILSLLPGPPVTLKKDDRGEIPLVAYVVVVIVAIVVAVIVLFHDTTYPIIGGLVLIVLTLLAQVFKPKPNPGPTPNPNPNPGPKAWPGVTYTTVGAATVARIDKQAWLAGGGKIIKDSIDDMKWYIFEYWIDEGPGSWSWWQISSSAHYDDVNNVLHSYVDDPFYHPPPIEPDEEKKVVEAADPLQALVDYYPKFATEIKFLVVYGDVQGEADYQAYVKEGSNGDWHQFIALGYLDAAYNKRKTLWTPTEVKVEVTALFQRFYYLKAVHAVRKASR